MNLKFDVSVLLLILVSCIKSEENLLKNPFLKRFSTVDYDSDSLVEKHSRVQRSLDSNINLLFKSHGREFHLILIPTDKNNFDTEFIEFSDHVIELPKIIYYEGYLHDEPETSFISGSIIDGAFIGVIDTKSGKYFLEPASRFDKTLKAHSIIYHENDVNSNEQVKAAKNDINKFLDESGINNVFMSDNGITGVGCGLHSDKIRNRLFAEQKKFTLKNNTEQQSSNSRKKRQTGQLSFPSGKSSCNLYLRADPYFYDAIFNNEGKKDLTATITYITSYFNQQVTSLNNIYNNVQFYTDSSNTSYYKGVQFKIQKFKIFKSSDCQVGSTSSLTTGEQSLCSKNLDVLTFLNNVALDNYDQYCLSFTFTNRNFNDGSLGLAWTASTTAIGGICSKQTSVNGVSKSFNSGIVTINNYASRVPQLIQQLTFAHEVGHTFGANHDNSSYCPGTASGGNYIMWAQANPGTLANNKLFSSCSISFMGPVLKNVLNSNSNNCFQSPSAAICGNGVVETGEQCDCGTSDECTDKCCVASTCQLASGAICSPSQGPCCSSNCAISASNVVCSVAADCTNTSFCDGINLACPVPPKAPDFTVCNSQTQICLNGTCSGSVCQIYGLSQCFLTEGLLNSTADKTKLCELACTGNSTNNVCTSSFDIPSFNNLGVYLIPGSICGGTYGFCDSLSKCRIAGAQNALNRLIKSLLTPPTINDVKTWVKTYWWAILIFCIIFLVLFNLVIFALSKLLPSSNPNKFKKTKRTTSRQQLRPNSQLSTVKESARSKQNIFSTNFSDDLDENNLEKYKRKSKSRKAKILT